MGNIKKITIQGLKKFEKFEMEFNEKINIIIGENESGKSSIIEAINIVLNEQYKNYDKYIIKEMINTKVLKRFEENPIIENLPAIYIELILNIDEREEDFFGEQNLTYIRTRESSGSEECGIVFECKFNEDEFGDIVNLDDFNGEIPYEYYSMRWTTFKGNSYNSIKKPISIINIDNSKTDSNNSFNYFNKSLFQATYSYKEQIELKQDFRNKIKEFNDNITNESENKFQINNRKIALESLINILNDGVPIQNKGKGMENLIKTKMSLKKVRDKGKKLDVITIEEPENHLCYSNLKNMIDILKDNEDASQLIITTHNSLIATTFGLNNIIWISENGVNSLKDIAKDTSKFFIKADNNELLKLLISKSVILVEGNTEYMLIPHMYEQYKGEKLPNDISIISCHGITYKRYLEVTKNIKKKVVVITDNDGKQKNINDIKKLNKELESNNQKIFTDGDIKNNTWEISLLNTGNNKLELCKELNKEPDKLASHMLKDKANTAYEILIKNVKLELPLYVKEAIDWITN